MLPVTVKDIVVVVAPPYSKLRKPKKSLSFSGIQSFE